MEFFRRAPGTPGKLGILAGSFNPPTCAHLALAHSALSVVDEVVFVLPRVFPHKPYEGASFEDRVRMLELAAAGEPRFSIASSEHGLFIEIAREYREAYGPATEFYFLTGSDAADRIVNWDYGHPGAFLQQLNEYQLLVAPRRGVYEPPAEMRERIHSLALAEGYDEVSATEVRERAKGGKPWQPLVPEQVREMVLRIYAPRGRGEP